MENLSDLTSFQMRAVLNLKITFSHSLPVSRVEQTYKTLRKRFV